MRKCYTINRICRCLLIASLAMSPTITVAGEENHPSTQNENPMIKNSNAPSFSTRSPYAYSTIEISKSARDQREYRELVLPNKMRVLLVSDPKATKSLSALALPIGSLDDPKDQQGLAHYLEHMVLMGSQHYPEPDGFAQFLSRHGGSHNASTASYRTAYYLEVEHDAFADATARLADAIAAPLFDRTYSDRERNAVNSELTMARSRDGMRMGQVDAETLNPAHPTSQFSGGNLETLSDKPQSKLHDALLSFYQSYYSANLMVGVLYSNQSIDEMARLADSSFGRIQNRDATVPTIDVPPATEKEKGVIIHYVPAQPTKQLRIDFRIDNNIAQFRTKSENYIGYLLSEQGENTLADRLQKAGLIESIGTGVDPVIDRNGGIFIIAVTLTEKGLANRDSVVAAIFDYLNMIKEKGIDKRYFDELSHVLALDFQYQSITRNMSYVEDLADTLLRLPVENVLNGDYLADQFDPQAIKARLDEFTPENARIWYISPNEPTDKKAYFVDAAYQVQPISAEQKATWAKLTGEFDLELAPLNPYIPDDFSIKSSQERFNTPNWVVQEKNSRAMLVNSLYFGDEPKGNVVVALRNALTGQDAKHQVMSSLLSYLADLHLAQLSYQSGVGGISFSAADNNGLIFTASGFTQRMPELFGKLFSEYKAFTPTEQELIQAKAWYKQRLDAAEKVKAYELALQPIHSLNSARYTERSERRAQLDKISVEDLLAYREMTLNQATPEIFAIGNFNQQDISALDALTRTTFATQGETWWHGENQLLDKPKKVVFKLKGSSTDSALAAVYLPQGYERISGIARSSLLTQIVHPWFFKQLRTEEQLGYALFAFPTMVGDKAGIGFLLQSSDKTPSYLYERYQAFFTQTAKRLDEMSEADFTQYKRSMINQLKEEPQTLAQEASRYAQDFNRSNYAFDSRDKLIAEVEGLTKADLIDYFNRSVVQLDGVAILAQVVGEQAGEDALANGYIVPQGWQTEEQVSSLQKQFMTEVRP